eukprot:TRINITY_DN1662_c0_g6_i1.p1 TRINITY_DN1662_c0_g6~~TRINITY_DN1662_c0_g6_i1.p1  ORF type:complete len:359 (-),score=72.97 TRINITY_DN1662_c0_g6_i1:87-1163(-)
MAAKGNESVVLTQEEKELLAKYRSKVSEANGMSKGHQTFFVANKDTESHKRPLRNTKDHLNAIKFDAGKSVRELTGRGADEKSGTFSSDQYSFRRPKDSSDEQLESANTIEEMKGEMYANMEGRQSKRILVAELRDLEAKFKSEPSKVNLHLDLSSREQLHADQIPASGRPHNLQRNNDTITLDNKSLEEFLQSNIGVNLKAYLNNEELVSLPSRKSTVEVQTNNKESIESTCRINPQIKEEHKIFQGNTSTERPSEQSKDAKRDSRRHDAKRYIEVVRKGKTSRSDSIPLKKAKKSADTSHIAKGKDVPEKRNTLTRRMKSKISEVLDKNERLWQLVKKHSKECASFAAELKRQGLL